MLFRKDCNRLNITGDLAHHEFECGIELPAVLASVIQPSAMALPGGATSTLVQLLALPLQVAHAYAKYSFENVECTRNTPRTSEN